MEDILREILFELKEIKKEIRADGNSSNPIEIKLLIDEDVIVKKVIKTINNSNKLSKDVTLLV